MEPETNNEVSQEDEALNSFNTVTPLSKYLAIVLFVILPFVGGWVGYQYAPEKVVEIERIVEVERTAEVDTLFSNNTEEEVVSCEFGSVDWDVYQDCLSRKMDSISTHPELVKLEISGTETEAVGNWPLQVTFAKKVGKDVDVITRNLENKTEKVLFSYEELKEYKGTGNYWSDLSPSIDWSSSTNSFVYSDFQGLWVYNPDDELSEMIIAHPVSLDPDYEDFGPYSFYEPKWIDDTSFSYSAAFYEGKGVGEYDLLTQQDTLDFLGMGDDGQYQERILSNEQVSVSYLRETYYSGQRIVSANDSGNQNFVWAVELPSYFKWQTFDLVNQAVVLSGCSREGEGCVFLAIDANTGNTIYESSLIGDVVTLLGFNE